MSWFRGSSASTPVEDASQKVEDASPKYELKVRPTGAPAEVYLLDAHFRPVADAFGTLETSVPKGIYKLKLRAGLQTTEEHLIVRGDEAALEKIYDPLAFSSPAPLWGTAKWYEEDAAVARKESRTVHVQAGGGSWIFVFARDWIKESSAALRVEDAHPASGLTVRRTNGELVADVETAAVVRMTGNPCAACNIQVDPGSYLLDLELPGNGHLQQTVVAAPGWQTEVFLLQRDYQPLAEIRRVDLAGSGIFMAQPRGFDDRRSELRLTELVRVALMYPRRLVRNHVVQTLREGVTEPVLGIYGAHLLFMPYERAHDTLISDTLGHVRSLLGVTHPDIEAIALRANQDAPVAPFIVPPMLCRSWDFVCKATASRPELVPAGSLSERMANRLWGDGQWLVWHEPADTSTAEKEVEEAVAIAITLLARKRLANDPDAAPWARQITKALSDVLGAPVLAALALEPDRVAPLQMVASLARRIYQRALDVMPGVGTDAEIPTGGSDSTVLGDPAQALRDLRATLNKESIARLVQAIGLPRGRIERLLDDMENRLDQHR